MQERLLQFIWQYNLYKPNGLFTSHGEAIRVIHGGVLNTHAGPDFSEARIKIGQTTLIGNIELHVRTSDWAKHGHQEDDAYRKLILHVVFHHDIEVLPNDIPVLELGPHIPPYVIEQYSSLLQTTALLPCARQLERVRLIIKESWLNRLLVERWEHKLQRWQQELEQANHDWRTLLYWRMAANFGFKVNATPFLLLAQSLPMQLLSKQHGIKQIEALIFGQAGMLGSTFQDDYPRELQVEYQYLKHSLTSHPLPAIYGNFCA